MKVQNFYFLFYYWGAIYLHPVLLGKWAELPGFFLYLCPNKCFFHRKYASKVLYKEFALQRSFVVILWINKVGGTWKINNEMALKSRSYILDVDRIKLSLGIFFFLGCFIAIFFTSFQDVPFLLLSKAANLPFS